MMSVNFTSAMATRVGGAKRGGVAKDTAVVSKVPTPAVNGFGRAARLGGGVCRSSVSLVRRRSDAIVVVRAAADEEQAGAGAVEQGEAQQLALGLKCNALGFS